MNTQILCFVDRASRYNYVTKTHVMHYLSSVYFVNQPVHASDIFVAHHSEVYRICVCVCVCVCVCRPGSSVGIATD